MIVLLSLCIVRNAQCQTVLLNIAKAGTLSTLLGNNADHVKEITLTGPLNGSDIYTIRNMDSLSILNMADAVIVSGGNAYLDNGSQVFYSSDSEIGPWAFSNFKNLESLILPRSLTSIGTCAFISCTNLSSVTLQDKLVSIGDGAFSGCLKLDSISIPQSVTSIGQSVFFSCLKMSKIIVSKNNPNFCSLDGTLFNKDTTLILTCPAGKFSQFTIPDGVTSISKFAFAECYGLTSISIPKSVTTIGEYAFEDCRGLNSITFTENITSFGSYLLAGCTNLTAIHCQNKIPPTISSYVFGNINPSQIKLYIPINSYALYWNTSYWSDFLRMSEEDPTLISPVTFRDIRVYSEQDALIIKGLKLGDEVLAYTIRGTLLKRIISSSERIKIDLPRHNIYLISTSKRIFKVSIE